MPNHSPPRCFLHESQLGGASQYLAWELTLWMLLGCCIFNTSSRTALSHLGSPRLLLALLSLFLLCVAHHHSLHHLHHYQHHRHCFYLQGIDSAAQAELARRLLSAGLCFHGYQQLSYMILSRVTPVTHSIGNCVKRVVVIVASVIAFNHPLSTQNAIGTGLALFGVFLYSQAKRRFKDSPKPKAA